MVNSRLIMPSNRKFGLFFTAIFLIFGAYAYWKAAVLYLVLSGAIASLFFIVTVIAPKLLTPLNRLWFNIGLHLGRVVSPIILGLIFFMLITPVALITRIFGRDALRLRRRQIDSYWIIRESPGIDSQSFKNQY